MTNDQTNNMNNDGMNSGDYQPDINADELCIAAMLRACADGELCPEGCDRLKQYLAEHPEAKAQVAFEQSLKNSCDRVLSEPVCPDSLRAKIQGIASESATAAAIEQSNERTKSRSFWRANPMLSGLAAALVLAGGALIWQSSSIISKNSGLGFVDSTPVAYAERVGNFVAREHMRCCEERAASKKLVINDLGEMTAYFSEKFDLSVVSPVSSDGSSEVEFYGGGDCHVPATNSSGHLRFDATGPDGQRVSLSLFMAPDPGLLGLQEGMTYKLDSTQCAEQGANLFAWVQDGVMYLLVSEADETMCASVRGMMNAPTELRRL